MSGCYDILVAGGGASGLACAVHAAQEGARVAVVERDVACGLKILATGNGRCNYSNARLDPARYNDPEFVARAMGPEPEAEIERFFDGLGLFSSCEEGRLYPSSRRAESVRDVLLRACDRLGVALLDCHDAFAADWGDDRWTVRAHVPAKKPRLPKRDAGNERKLRRALEAAEKVERAVEGHALVVATGGAASLAGTLGLPCKPPQPVLCPISCRAPWLSRLDGQRAVCSAALLRDGKPLYRETGEVLFRAYGLSGIVAFDLSRRVEAGDSIELDLFPSLSRSELLERFSARERAFGAPDNPSWLAGALAMPLAEAVAAEAEARFGELSAPALAEAATHLALAVNGVAETDRAQVARGGIDRSAVDPASMRVAGRPCLCATGEALDVDADCGGFNLAWAWISGMRAADALRPR